MSDVNKTNTLEQANAPPDTELLIPENLPPIKVMNPGLYKNLCEQLTNQRHFKSHLIISYKDGRTIRPSCN